MHWYSINFIDKTEERIGGKMKRIACLIAVLIAVMPGLAVRACTLTISSTEGGSVTSPGEGFFEYAQATVVSVRATADENYHFVRWTGSANVADPYSASTTVTLSAGENSSLHAKFEINRYTITPSAGPGGSIYPSSPVTVDAGSSVVFTARPDTGYKVYRWLVDGVMVKSGGNSYTLSDIYADHTVHVTFTSILYKITPSAGQNGSIYPDFTVMVELGGSQSFTAEPNPGYEVDRWYVDGQMVQTGGTIYTLSDIHADHTVHVTFRQLLSYSLNKMGFDDDEQFATRIGHNNFIDPVHPERSQIYVERIVGLAPDPKGMMRMRNLRDLNQASPTYGQIVYARAKGLFAKIGVDEILIRFKYLFETSAPGVELVIYLSDVRTLLAHGDPERALHYIEVARLPAPPPPRPGSAGSGRFGIFEKIVWTGHLNFTEGVWIELELIGAESDMFVSYGHIRAQSTQSEDTSVLIDDWNPAVQCYGICLDINWDNFVDEVDFLMVIGECGYTATEERACLDGVFSSDGYVDSYDIFSWDWAMHTEDRLLNFCGVPLVGGGTATLSIASTEFKDFSQQLPLADLSINLSDLLIVGKRGPQDAAGKLEDRVYAFDQSGECVAWSELPSPRCNIRLVQDSEGRLYQLNSETGVLRLNGTNKVIIPPGKVSDINEPRYNKPATVYVGIQSQGPDSFGRPILDTAFDEDYVYVVPVVVNPEGQDSYTAAAKLQLLDAGGTLQGGNPNPPYQVVQLYDEPPLANDNQYRDALREIELDSAGNVYVVNVHSLNESDILWKYGLDGTVESFELARPDSNVYLPAPAAMYVSKTTNTLYLASAQYNPADVYSTVIYGFSTDGALALQRSITLTGMQHVTGITEDPLTGSLWVVGFNMEAVPLYPNPTQPPFYYPYLAEIAQDSNKINLISLLDPTSHDLALPVSVVWNTKAQ